MRGLAGHEHTTARLPQSRHVKDRDVIVVDVVVDAQDKLHNEGRLGSCYDLTVK